MGSVGGEKNGTLTSLLSSRPLKSYLPFSLYPQKIHHCFAVSETVTVTKN